MLIAILTVLAIPPTTLDRTLTRSGANTFLHYATGPTSDLAHYYTLSRLIFTTYIHPRLSLPDLGLLRDAPSRHAEHEDAQRDAGPPPIAAALL
jgi:hypothetical protein